jgi:hypothetical protein
VRQIYSLDHSEGTEPGIDFARCAKSTPCGRNYRPPAELSSDLLVVDAAGTAGNELAAVNDPKGKIVKNKPAPDNAIMLEVLYKGWPHILLFTTTTVREGEKILFHYGKNYHQFSAWVDNFDGCRGLRDNDRNLMHETNRVLQRLPQTAVDWGNRERHEEQRPMSKRERKSKQSYDPAVAAQAATATRSSQPLGRRLRSSRGRAECVRRGEAVEWHT